ncbi:hypothetical protein Barb7_02840 [Bacteroidales bacterium Barb7]|nr:hypothetical protein Barb7_02840 [Bacteroidales bacterium Barb7]
MPEVAKVGSIFIKGIDFAGGRYFFEGIVADFTVIGIGPLEVNTHNALAILEGTAVDFSHGGGYGQVGKRGTVGKGPLSDGFNVAGEGQAGK